ncbi:MAG: 50S ribosomal protein L3 [Deltaproteobacteria bacterium]|nr:50S ribosomal protein L3 [Deltaproteobacteria bacterium]
MKLGIVGRKVGMTQVFDDNGNVVPITVIDTSNCFVTQIKTKSTDGYTAVQVGFGEKKPQNVTKPEMGHFKKAGVQARRSTKELRCENTDDVTQLKPGQTLSVGMFEKGDHVDVAGNTRGKGFQGVMKRWGFHGCDASHGGHKYFRHGGSSGSNTFPGKVLKNKGMPGHTGDVLRTVSNLKVVDVKPEQNLIFLKGAVPGAKNGMLVLRVSNRSKKQPTGRTLTK